MTIYQETGFALVLLAVPAGATLDEGGLESGTTNGRIQSEIPVTVQGRIDRQLSVELGRGGPSIRVFTTNGGVSLSRR